MERTGVLVIGYGHEKLPNVSHGTGGVDFVHEHHVLEWMKVLSLEHMDFFT